MKEYTFELSAAMQKAGITTIELSEKTGIPKTTINEYRSARKKEPTLYRGLLIAQALNIDPWELIKEK